MSFLFDRMFPPPGRVAHALAELEDLFSADLPSRIDGSYLRAECTVRWLGPVETAAEDRQVLRRSIVGYLYPEARRHTAAHLETAELAVNARLAVMTPPPETTMHRVTVSARLTADTQSREAAGEWERLRTRLTINRLNAQLEVERLRHLRDDIFARPDIARTYWLDKHPTAMEEVLDDRFERVAEKLTSGPLPSTLAVANVIREFLTGLGPEHKQVMMELLHKTLADFGRADLSRGLPPEPDCPSA
jgi:hypothetical protein